MSPLASSFADPAQPRLPLPEVPALSERWAALAGAARAVAVLAGEAFEDTGTAELIEQAAPWRRERALHHLADLSAMMEPGLSALLAVRGRGADPAPAAGALLYEFARAHAALRALVAPAI